MVMFENPLWHFNIFSRYSQQIVNQAILFIFAIYKLHYIKITSIHGNQ